MTIDERISSELRRHAPEVDERAAWERIQSAAPARHRVWARRWMPITVAAVAVVVIGIALVQTFPWDPTPIAALESPFRGTWFSTDDDGSAETMTVPIRSAVGDRNSTPNAGTTHASTSSRPISMPTLNDTSDAAR